MQTQTQITSATIIMLNEAEKEWLKAIMQNPMWVDCPTKENEHDKEMRLRFWQALGGRVLS